MLGAHLTCVTVSVTTDARMRAGLKSPGSLAVTAHSSSTQSRSAAGGEVKYGRGMEGLWGNTNKLAGEIPLLEKDKHGDRQPC